MLLSNDPGLGDPEVITAGAGIFLTFDYSFVEGINSNDEFGAFILDSTGASAGPDYELFTQDTSSGTVSFDLSGLTNEPFIGLQFQLLSFPGDSDLDSVVTIEDVQVIPEPTTICLISFGLLGLLGIIIRQRRHMK